MQLSSSFADPFAVVLLVASAVLAMPILLHLVVLRPRFGLYLLLTVIFLFDYMARDLKVLPSMVSWITDLVILALAIRFGLQLSRKQRPHGSFWYIDTWVLLLLILSLLGTVANTVSPTAYLLGLRFYFKYVFLFYLVVNETVTLPTVSLIEKAFWTIIVLQPILVGLQWLVSPCQNCYVDRYSGTLTSTATLSVVTGMASAVAFSRYFVCKEKKWLFLMVPMLIALGLADAKAGLWFVAIVVLFMWGYMTVFTRGIVGRLKLIAIVVPSAAVLFGAVYFAGQNLGLDVTTMFLNPTEAIAYKQYDEGYGDSISRVTDLMIAIEALDSAALGGGVGAGPGNGTGSTFSGLSGGIYNTFATKYGRVVFWLQASRVLVEFGYLGVLFFLGVYCGLWYLGHLAYHRLTVPAQRAEALAFMGFVLVMLATHFYQTIQDIPQFIFWLTAALLVRLLHAEEAKYRQASTRHAFQYAPVENPLPGR